MPKCRCFGPREMQQHSASDGAAAASQHSTKRRAARKAKITELFVTTASLFGDLAALTEGRWATVQLLTGHGLEQQSRRLAAHVQVLQSCCDANRDLLGEQQLTQGQSKHLHAYDRPGSTCTHSADVVVSSSGSHLCQQCAAAGGVD